MKWVGLLVLLAGVPVCAEEAQHGDPWGALVAYAFAKSAEQNGGEPLYRRQCNPAKGTCVNYVIFKNEAEVKTKVGSVQNTEDRIVRRFICRFNEMGDIQHCTDFDTGERFVSMKDNDTGKFVTVPKRRF